jgi:PAB-dependent poly(A)-specific ribonuclease subunit 2
MAVSPTGVYIALGDTEGVVRILTQQSTHGEELMPFNGFDGQPAEWADMPEALPEINWTDTTFVLSIHSTS